MGKPRRPRGPRSTSEPRPPLDQVPPAVLEPFPEAAPAEMASAAMAGPVPDASVSEAASVPEPDARPAPAPAEPVAEAPPAVPAAADPVEAVPAEAAPVEADLAEAAPAPSFPPPAVIPDAAGPAAPAGRAVAPRAAFAPEGLDLAGIGATIAGYVRGEGEAALAHLRALADARSPADLIRLQVGEVQRAADASLSCLSEVARKASRVFAPR